MVDDFGDYVPENAHHTHGARANEGIAKIIDLKLPLAWLISATVMISLSFGGLYMQVASISTQLDDLKSAQQTKDDQISLILQTLAGSKGVTDTEQVEINQNTQDIQALNLQFQQLQKSMTWMPGNAKN